MKSHSLTQRLLILSSLLLFQSCSETIEIPMTTLSTTVDFDLDEIAYAEIVTSLPISDSISYSRDGRLLLASTKHQAVIFETVGWNEIATLVVSERRNGQLLNSQDFPAQILHSDLSANGKVAATGHTNGEVRLWSVANGEMTASMHKHTDTVRSIQFNPEGSRIVSGSADGKAMVWDAQTSNLIQVLEGHDDSVETALYSANGEMILTSSRDGTARIWTGSTAVTLNDTEDPTIWHAEFSADGTKVVTASKEGSAIIWDARSGRNIREILRSDNFVSTAKFSPDGEWLATVEARVSLKIWSAKSGELLYEYDNRLGKPRHVDFSPNGAFVAISVASGSPVIWDPLGDRYISTGGEIVTTSSGARFVPTCHSKDVAFRRDGRQFVGRCSIPLAWEFVAEAKDKKVGK